MDENLKISHNSILDYNQVLEGGICPNCKNYLKWNLVVGFNSDDRFCHSECCGTLFSMVPETIKIITTKIRQIDCEEDSDFLRELS